MERLVQSSVRKRGFSTVATEPDVVAGVIGVQGDVEEHLSMINRFGDEMDIDIDVYAIREAGLVERCDALFIPGGESTTISKLVDSQGIAGEIEMHVESDKPVLATCAGLIICAKEVDSNDVLNLGLIDIAVERNAFGRQKESFEAMVDISFLEDRFPGVFIRAPVVSEVGDGVDVVARIEEKIVGVRKGSFLGLSFHPELTGDTRIHREVLSQV